MYNKIDNMTGDISPLWASYGNIVNLRPATVGYDSASGRALFSLVSDLRYVLEHAGKYIRPLQNHGRKVCICIQGGGKGIGFCNMTAAQITDFTRQVKEVIELYGLDGINLWDEESNYGKEGMPAVNTTSYPALIKALREAMPDKLLTLVDKDEPTEYFYDVSRCGGVEVGKYIDYAWHGYNSEEEFVQLIEPWEAEHPYSDYTRKPITGLTPDKYGSLNVPRYRNRTDLPYDLNVEGLKKVAKWKTEKRKKNNMIVFGFDLTANEQGPYEFQPHGKAMGFLEYLADDGMVWGQDPWTGEWGVQPSEYTYYLAQNNMDYQAGYRLYWKDW